MSARLIAPVIEQGGFVGGFQWCEDVLADAGYPALAGEVALAKAAMFMDSQDYAKAAAVLKVGPLHASPC